MKRKLLSLLLSAVMLFTLVTPAFADEERLPDEAAVEEDTVGGKNVTEDEEVTLFEGEGSTVPPVAPPSGGGGGGSDYDGDYCYDEDGVATFTLYGGFRAAMEDENVTAVRIEENHHVTFSSFDENIEITKPLIIDGLLRIENTCVMATADVTVNGALEVFGDDDFYTELRMEAPESYWDDFTEAPDTLDGPKLINKGRIEMTGLSGVLLAWPCDYVRGGELSVGEFKYADYLNYYSHDEDDGLTVRYTEEQMTIRYMDGALRTAFVNTEKGLLAALKSKVYNSSIQVYGDGVALSTAGEYTAPCTLMTNAPFTVGEGVTLNLADGTFNQFNNGLTVAGTLNVNTNGNMCFVNGDTQIVPGGTLINQSGSTLCFNGNVTVAGEEDGKHGELHNSFGFMQFFGAANIDGFFLNQGRAENHNEMTVRGMLRVEEDGVELRYQNNPDELTHHALYNYNELHIGPGGQLHVNGYFENKGYTEACGALVAHATAFDNLSEGVVNGCIVNCGEVCVNGGELLLEGPQPAYPEYETPEKPFGGVFANKWGEGESCLALENDGRVNAKGYLVNVCRLDINDGCLNVSGRMENYGETNANGGELSVIAGGSLYNYGDVNVERGGSFSQEGYVQNDRMIRVSDYYALQSAAADNTNNGNCVGQDSVLCNNGDLNINGGGELDVSGGTFAGIIHNNGFVKIDGTLKLVGLLRNFNTVENRGSFTVSGTAARIENHGHLRVGDSATFGGDEFGRINWQDGASAENNIEDEQVYRIWLVYGPDYRKLEENFNSIKDSELYGNIVMFGQDYFGGWADATNCTVETENENIVSINTEGELYGTFRLLFKEWGDTKLNVKVGDKVVRSYDARTCLNYDGFYYDRDVLRFEDDEIRLDTDRAQEVAVLGNTVYNLGADTALWFVREDGFDWDEINDTWVKIKGQDVELGRPDDNGWYHACVEDREYLMLRAEPRNYDEGILDVLCLLNDDVLERFDLELHVGGSNGYLRCEYNENRPEVYIENTAVQTAEGSTVTVAVKAKNVGEIGGFDLTVGYDADAFTFTGAELNGEFMPLEDYTAENGSVRIPSAACDANEGVDCTEDTLLFTLTFKTTRELDAEDDLHLWFDGGENMLTTLDNRPQKKPAARRSGTVEAFIPGDVLRDGKVDIRDAVRLLRASAKLVNDLSAAEREAALIVKDETEPSVNGVLALLNHLAKGTELVYKPAAQG